MLNQRKQRLPTKRSRRDAKRQARKRLRRQPLLESLEPRMMLASDFLSDAASEAGGRPAWELVSDGTDLQLRISPGGSVLKSLPLADRSGKVVVTGSAAAQSLAINVSAALTSDSAPEGFVDSLALTADMGGGDDVVRYVGSITVAATVSSGGGNDQLQGADKDAEWELTGVDAGTLDGRVVFGRRRGCAVRLHNGRRPTRTVSGHSARQTQAGPGIEGFAACDENRLAGPCHRCANPQKIAVFPLVLPFAISSN